MNKRALSINVDAQIEGRHSSQQGNGNYNGMPSNATTGQTTPKQKKKKNKSLKLQQSENAV